MMSGWLKPSDPTAADYWVTRRSADAAPGYDLGLPDLRVRYLWNGDVWVTGYHRGALGMDVELGCLHANNGWRIEGPA
jgi:hypothetical protein